LTVLILNKTTDEVLFTRVLGTHYTVEINRVTEGGAITFGGSFIPTSEQNVFIASEIPNTQPTSYILGGKLAEKSFEAMGDRLLRLIQQVLRKVDRSVKLPETDLGDAPVLPAAESGKAIGWDGAGGLTNMTLDPGTALSAASQADAEAGTDNVGYMTALRTKQAIDANTPEIASQADAEAGVNNTKFMTPLRTKQAIDENQTEAASAAEVKTGTEAAKYVAPSTVIAHEGVVKGWIVFNGTGTIAISESYNVSGITDNGTGDYTVVWDVDFATANYSVSGSSGITAPHYLGIAIREIAAGSTRIWVQRYDNGGITDAGYVSVQAIGDR
jgi:hypothetical protein